MSHHHHKLSRRKFLGQASCAALGSTTLFSSLANMLISSKIAQFNSSNTGDYKALVCILLAGGNDSYNMLVPKGASEYAEYATTRADLALAQNSLLSLNPITPIGKDLGVHPSMTGVQSLFDSGDLAFISNVGTLVEKVANNVEYQTKSLPLGLFSHSDQIQHWQTSVPQSREAIGWGGRMADMITGMGLNTTTDISMNISLSGRNIFQAGNTVLEYSISANHENGVEGIEQYKPWLSNSLFLQELRENTISDLATQMYGNVLQSTMGGLTQQTLDSFEFFKDALSNVNNFNTSFSDHYLSQNLRMTAKTIAAQQDLGMCRQTFFTTFGGWDHHDEVLNNQEYMLGVLSAAIDEFFQALDEIGMKDKVTLFTVSDFGRTLTSNGNGSDHAWGGNSIVAGGAVNGKEIYGNYPDLYLNGNPLMTSNDRGRIIPTTSTDEYFAEMALWFGVPASDLHLVLPNISEFYSPGSLNMPLGFLPMP